MYNYFLYSQSITDYAIFDFLQPEEPDTFQFSGTASLKIRVIDVQKNRNVQESFTHP